MNGEEGGPIEPYPPHSLALVFNSEIKREWSVAGGSQAGVVGVGCAMEVRGRKKIKKRGVMCGEGAGPVGRGRVI